LTDPEQEIAQLRADVARLQLVLGTLIGLLPQITQPIRWAGVTTILSTMLYADDPAAELPTVLESLDHDH